jgi:hypothetical protein
MTIGQVNRKQSFPAGIPKQSFGTRKENMKQSFRVCIPKQSFGTSSKQSSRI